MATKQIASRELFLKSDKNLTSDRTDKLAKRSELLPGSNRYPSQLIQLKDKPEKLYALGNVELLTTPALAIVGARKATPYGLECAHRFGKLAASRGITVVSGGAIGCDMAAHKGALDAGGSTAVVLGSGADVVYPLRARDLFIEILAAGGVLLSEAPWGSAPLAWAFSKRNRIIAALARATLIVEAGLPSGTFQTADHTLALGNDVLVVPGPIFSKESKGSNRLLFQGATPIVDDESFAQTLEHIFEDILFGAKQQQEVLDLKLEFDSPQPEEISDDAPITSLPHEIKERRLKEHIIESLQAKPMTVDALAEAYKVNVIEVVRSISKLELFGEVERISDGRYTATHKH